MSIDISDKTGMEITLNSLSTKKDVTSEAKSLILKSTALKIEKKICPYKNKLIVARRDDQGQLVDKDYVKKEINRAVQKGKNPFIVGLTSSGQRDVGNSLFSFLYSYLETTTKCSLEDTKTIKGSENFISNSFAEKSNMESTKDNTIGDKKDFDFENFVNYFRNLFKKAEIEITTIVITFIYLNRVIKSRKMPIGMFNIKRVFISCFQLAYSFNEDVRYSNSCLAEALKINLTLLMRNSAFIAEHILDWKLNVTKKEYNKFIFYPLAQYCITVPEIYNSIKKTNNENKI